MKIAAFDFDGTITSKDTLLEFIKFAKGMRKFLLGFIILCPIIVLYKTRLLNNGKAKQIVFRFFFRGMSINEFNSFCSNFSICIDKILNYDALCTIGEHQKEGDTVIIISASIENWIRPWAEKNGITEIIATKIEIDENSNLTGNFSTENCYGKEKKNRFLSAYPNRSDYTMYVYGDSSGDYSLMGLADKSFYRQFK